MIRIFSVFVILSLLIWCAQPLKLKDETVVTELTAVTEDNEVYLIMDQDGIEREYVRLYNFYYNGEMYSILARENNSDEGIIMRVDQEDGEEFLVSIADDAEWDAVSKIYNSFLEDEGSFQIVEKERLNNVL